MSSRRPLALAVTLSLGAALSAAAMTPAAAAPVLPHAPASAATPATLASIAHPAAVDPSAAPTPHFSLGGGRYEGPQSLELSAAGATEIRYTTDGTAPTRNSTLYEGPITLSANANVAAISIKDGAASAPAVRGYVIKSKEKPLLSFVMMSDVHTSSATPTNLKKWQQHFDTIKSLAPNADAIISNGDQINDNDGKTAPDHQVVSDIFSSNLQRTGLTPEIMLSHGNHDTSNALMAQYYPQDWFPAASTGYYEKTVNGYTFLVIDTEKYSVAQRTWLQNRLKELSALPGALNKPVFVVGHRPTANTVHDGAQSSNALLTTDLSLYPQAVYFSGHSHLQVNDERSIWQGAFTAVNDGSMSYVEVPHDALQVYGDVLVDEFTVATAQGLIVDVYADRTEIERINFAAEDDRTYKPDGSWGFQENPPFASAGTLAGKRWTVQLKGSTADEVKAGFGYTSASRDKSAPKMNGKLSARATETGTSLRIPAATDNTAVYGYSLDIKDAQTLQSVLPIKGGMKVLSGFQFSPTPASLDVPLAFRDSVKPTGTTTRLEAGKAYVATVAAVDMVGNTSTPQTVEFVAGEVDRTGIDEALKAHTPAAERLQRILDGKPEAAQLADFDVALKDSGAAQEALAAWASALEAAQAPSTQDAADRAASELSAAAKAMEAAVVSVDRQPLRAAVQRADSLLDGGGAPSSRAARAAALTPAEAEAQLRQVRAEASETLATLNVQQEALDALTQRVNSAADAFESAEEPVTPTEPTSTTDPGATGEPTPNPTATPSEPSVSPSASATPTATATPAPSVDPSEPTPGPGKPGGGAGNAGEESEGGLAATGAAVGGIAAGAAALAALGAGGMILRRRLKA